MAKRNEELDLEDSDGREDLEEIELIDEEDREEETDEFGMTCEAWDELCMTLRTEFTAEEMASKERLDKYQKWRGQVEAQPKAKLRSINPLRNPSNVMPPLTQIHQQTMSANLIAYFSQTPFWNWKALKDEDKARIQATFLTKYFKMLSESPSDLNMEPVKRTICMETSLMDKCVVKVPYTVHEWGYKKSDTDGSAEMKVMTYHEGPELIPIPQEDFIYPAQWDDIRYMPWVCHVIHLPEHELVARGEAGIYKCVEEVVNFGRETPSAAERAIGSAAGEDLTNFGKVYDIGEFYCFYDADGDGQYEDYIITMDLYTGKRLRVEYNDVGMRPFEPFVFIARPGSLGGRGVGQICEGLQDECEGIHNARNDNIKIANMRMLSMSRATKIANGEEIYPGKIWINDGDNEVKSIQLGEVYPSSLQAEELTWKLAAQATGMSEVMRGFGDPTLGQRDTYRGQQMRMNSAKGIFGTIADGMKESFSRVALLIMLQLINHREEVIAREEKIQRLTRDEMQMLEEILSVEPSEVPQRFAFTVNSVDQDATPGAKMQALQQFAQIYNMWGQQTTAVAMQIFTPQGLMMQQQAPELYQHLLTIYAGSAHFMAQVLKLSGIEDKPETYVPDTSMWEQLISMANRMKQEQAKMMEVRNGQSQLGGSDTELAPPAAAGDEAGFGSAGLGGSGDFGFGGGAGSAGAGDVGSFQGSGMGNPGGTGS